MRYRFLICTECDSTNQFAAFLAKKLSEVNAADENDKLSTFAFGDYLDIYGIKTEFSECHLAGFKDEIAFFDNQGKRFFSVTYVEVLPIPF